MGLDLEAQKRIEEILSQIESDRENGATYLAGCALEVLENFAISLEGGAQAADSSLQDLVKRIGGIRPSIGAIKTQVTLVYRRVEEIVKKGTPLPEALELVVGEERKKLEEADQIIADIALEEIGTGGTIVTCSSSDTVRSVVQKLRPNLVVLAEGHPLGDGARAAKWFSANGFEVRLVSDSALSTVVDGAKAVLIGADQVLADGSVVNRCSSLSLALSASYFKVPFYVACQRIKLSGLQSVTIEEYSEYGQTGGVPVSVPLFDITPANLVKTILTDMGVMSPEEAGKIGLEIIY